MDSYVCYVGQCHIRSYNTGFVRGARRSSAVERPLAVRWVVGPIPRGGPNGPFHATAIMVTELIAM